MTGSLTSKKTCVAYGSRTRGERTEVSKDPVHPILVCVSLTAQNGPLTDVFGDTPKRGPTDFRGGTRRAAEDAP